MILGAEIALTVVGLMLLFRGRSIGKDPVSHPQFRLLGAFLVTLFPVAMVGGIVFGLIWFATHPDATPDTFAADARWPITGLELGVVVTYVIIGTLWEKAIKRKVASAPEKDPFAS